MKKIAPNLYTFRGLIIGRVYLIIDPDGLTLIDTGIELAPERIMKQLRAVGRQPHEVKRILITHAHADHIGGLPELQRTTGAAVIASALERLVIEGTIPVPTPPRDELSGPAALMRLPETRLKPTPVDRVVSEGDRLDEVLGGVEVLAVPGHAPGHLAFWQPRQRILFCGDVVMHLPWGLSLPVPAFTVNMAENRRSVGRLAGLEPAILCAGHGTPITNDAAAILRRFADKVAVV